MDRYTFFWLHFSFFMGDSRKISKKGRYPSRDFNGPLVGCVHIKTSTVTETVYKQPVVMMSNRKIIVFSIQLLWNNYETYSSIPKYVPPHPANFSLTKGIFKWCVLVFVGEGGVKHKRITCGMLGEPQGKLVN